MDYIVKSVVMIGTNENVSYAEKPNLDGVYRYMDELKALYGDGLVEFAYYEFSRRLVALPHVPNAHHFNE